MKALDTIEFTDINPIAHYIITVTPPGSDADVYSDTGENVIEALKDIFDWDRDEYEYLQSFLETAQSLSGDGWPMVVVYSI